jgi:hypothetical protein
LTIELSHLPAFITRIYLKNTHNSHGKDRATKKFRLLVSLSADGPWTALLERSLEDSRQEASPPVLELLLDQPIEVRFLKFELLEFWGKGGGLQFLDTRFWHRDSRLTWPESETECQAQGGHLASILTAEDQEAVAEVANGRSVWVWGW